MALISNGTTVASGGNVQAPTLTGNLPAISGASLTGVSVSNSTILSGVASASAGAVGSYALLNKSDDANYSRGDTTSGSLTFVSVVGGSDGYNLSASGTWRCMGHKIAQNVLAPQTTMWLRIS